MKINLAGAGAAAATPEQRFQRAREELAAAKPGQRAGAMGSLVVLASNALVPAKRIVPELERWLASAPDRLAAAMCLAKIDAVTWLPSLHAALLACLRAPGTDDDGYAAASTLARSAEPELIASVRSSAVASSRDGDTAVFSFAAGTLGGLVEAGDLESIRVLESFLGDTRELPREAAARALARSKNPAAIAALAKRHRTR